LSLLEMFRNIRLFRNKSLVSRQVTCFETCDLFRDSFEGGCNFFSEVVGLRGRSATGEAGRRGSRTGYHVPLLWQDGSVCLNTIASPGRELSETCRDAVGSPERKQRSKNKPHKNLLWALGCAGRSACPYHDSGCLYSWMSPTDWP
jgi:hypothetical protein